VRPIATVRVPVALAREIDRLLHCAETLPIIGGDAARARGELNALDPRAFKGEPHVGTLACNVCCEPIPMTRNITAAKISGKAATYCSDRCRETARKRRARAT